MATQLQICQMALAEIGTRSTITAINDGSEEALYLNMYYTSVRDQALRAARWNFARKYALLSLFKAMPGTPENPTPATTSGWQTTYPPPPWLYSYYIPADYLYARSVIPQPDISTISPPLFPVAGSNLAYPRTIRVPFDVYLDAGSPGFTTQSVIDKFGNTTTIQVPIVVSPARYIASNAQSPIFEYTAQIPVGQENIFDSLFTMTFVKALAGYIAVALSGDKALAQMKIQEANGLILQARAADGNEGITVLDHTPDWLQARGVGGTQGDSSFYWPYDAMFTWPTL